MAYKVMSLKVLLPYKVFTDKVDVKRIVVETNMGAYGILPNRQDCVMVLEPGILTYEIVEAEEVYIAVDAGILVKTGSEVRVSVRNASGGVSLDKLNETLEKDFFKINKQEEIDRSVLKEMESSFIKRLVRYNHGK